jgi:hypothetical protein
VGGKVVAARTMERTIPIRLPIDETFHIGPDTGDPDQRSDAVHVHRQDRQADDSARSAVLTEDDKNKLMVAFRAARTITSSGV